MCIRDRLYVGEPQKLKNLGQDLISKLESFSISLSCDGIFQEQGTGSNVLGSPLKAVSHLIKVIANYQGPNICRLENWLLQVP